MCSRVNESISKTLPLIIMALNVQSFDFNTLYIIERIVDDSLPRSVVNLVVRFGFVFGWRRRIKHRLLRLSALIFIFIKIFMCKTLWSHVQDLVTHDTYTHVFNHQVPQIPVKRERKVGLPDEVRERVTQVLKTLWCSEVIGFNIKNQDGMTWPKF